MARPPWRIRPSPTHEVPSPARRGSEQRARIPTGRGDARVARPARPHPNPHYPHVVGSAVRTDVWRGHVGLMDKAVRDNSATEVCVGWRPVASPNAVRWVARPDPTAHYPRVVGSAVSVTMSGEANAGLMDEAVRGASATEACVGWHSVASPMSAGRARPRSDRAIRKTVVIVSSHRPGDACVAPTRPMTGW